MTIDRDNELKERLAEENDEYRTLMQEHVEFERILEKYNQKPYLAPDEEVERKNVQKLKLKGKDRMETIFAEYKKQLSG